MARGVRCSARMLCTHVVARAMRLPIPLTHPEVAAWLWKRLREAFPEALAALLMSNHIHLIAEGRVEEARRRMAAVLGGLRRSRNRGAHIRWEPVSVEGCFEDPVKASRQSRYVLLNPSRAGLIEDPLAWAWSTHRDVLGAVADPWVTAERLASALGRPRAGFEAWFHAYVSSDPSVHVAGTPLPRPEPPARFSLVPLGDVLAAACAASRSAPVAVRDKGSTARKLFLGLARDQGWRDPRQLAAICGISKRSVNRLLAHADGEGLDAAALCLGDRRLRAGLGDSVREFLRALPVVQTGVAGRARLHGRHALDDGSLAPRPLGLW